MTKKILFVCTGNTCRSPMAEGLLRKLAADRGLPWEALSAGIAAFPGVPVSAEAVEAAAEMGIDLAGKVSQPLGKAMVQESDLILTMTSKHRDMILKKIPELSGKVRMLSDLAGEGEVDVEDPVGQPVEAYRKVLAQMRGFLEKGLDGLK